jgi:Icc-related predicted phosphoesterase
MIVNCISDLHGDYDISTEPCDLLLVAGDVTRTGALEEFYSFIDWLDIQPAKNKVFVAGNHDWCLETQLSRALEKIKEKQPNIFYLQEQHIVIDGFKIFGSPFTPQYGMWSFMYHISYSANMWKKIEPDTDIILTHGPPNGILDAVPDGFNSNHFRNAGCPHLYKRVMEIKPKLHVFGHIHEGYGERIRDGVVFVNCSRKDRKYKSVNNIKKITLERKTNENP